MLFSVAALTAFAALAQANWCPQIGHCWVEPKSCMVKPCDKLCGNPAGDLFVVEHDAAYCDVHEVCQRNGGVLADITNVNFNDATHTAFQCTGPNTETWIQSWQHVTYAPNCLVLSTGSQPQGGAINVPESCGKRRFTMCSRSQPKREWHHKDHHCDHCKVKECEVVKKCDPCHKHHHKKHHHKKDHHKKNHHKKDHHKKDHKHRHGDVEPIHGARPHQMMAMGGNDYGIGQGVRPDMARGLDHHRPHGHHDHHHKKDKCKHCEKKHCPHCQPDKHGRCDHCPFEFRRECAKCNCKCDCEPSTSSCSSSTTDCSSSTSSCSESSSTCSCESSTSSCTESSSTSECGCRHHKDHHKKNHHKKDHKKHRHGGMEPLHGARPHQMMAMEGNDYGIGQGVRPDMARGLDHHRPHGHHDHHKDKCERCEKKHCPRCQPDQHGRCDHCPFEFRRECAKCHHKCHHKCHCEPSTSSCSSSSTTDCTSSTSSCSESSSTCSCESSTSSCTDSSTSSCSESSSTTDCGCHHHKDHHKDHHKKDHHKKDHHKKDHHKKDHHKKGHRGDHRMEPLRNHF